jgi:hypothetical protein
VVIAASGACMHVYVCVHEQGVCSRRLLRAVHVCMYMYVCMSKACAHCDCCEAMHSSAFFVCSCE